MTFSEKEVREETLKYFNGDELATDVWIKKYALRNKQDELLEKTPDDMHRRLAKEFARIESRYPNPLSEDEIYEKLKDFQKIIPQGSPMAGIGNNHSIQSIGNCFVLPSVIDSYGGILKTDQELVQLAKRRGGIGFDISNIRPKGMFTSNAAKTTDGIAPFMERFSNSCREVATSGRRGALMLTISVNHPEIETFLTIKNDLLKVTGANISVKFTDEFMEAVKNDKEYEQKWPVDSDDPVVSRKVPAKKIWDKFIHSAWKSAEPGSLFWDTINYWSPAHSYGKKDARFFNVSTNPCQPGFATVITPNGIKTFDDIKIGDTIWSKNGWTKIVNKWETGIKPVYEYLTTSGRFIGTENHQIVSKGEKIEVNDAQSIDILSCNDVNNIKHEIIDILDGLMIGDGSCHLASKDKVYLTIGENDNDYFTSEISPLLIEKHAVKYENAWKVLTSINENELPPIPERIIPDRFYYGNANKVAGFLKGLFSANGSVLEKYNRITLKSTSLKLIKQTQDMLSFLGIRSYFTTNKEKDINWKNGLYTSKASYDLNISTDRNIFKEKIGFLHTYKNNLLDNICKIKIIDKDKTGKIKEKIFLGNFPVFDITVDNDSHTYWTGGLNVSNCSEIAMCPDSCRLLIINPASYVINSFLDNAYFDYDSFYKDCKIAQRLMDDIVDLEIEKIEQILNKIDSDPEPDDVKFVEKRMWEMFLETAKLGRRTGTGPTAIGDTVAMLGIKYGSDESVEIVNNIYKILALASFESSCDMARERGPFPLYDFEIEKNHPFIEKLLNEKPSLRESYEKYGRRNIAMLTTAPAGSVSLLTQTTSGIEPVFLLSYKRRRKISHNEDKEVFSFIDDVGDKWIEYDIYHHNLKKWMELTGKTNVEESPYFGATSNDIDWLKTVELQAAATQWVDHAISKTCNLPSDVSEQLVSEVYMKAWETGCKGFTVYRDGSRTGVLVSSDEPKQSDAEIRFSPKDAPKRPETLPCDVHNVTIKDQNWTIFVGLMDGKPYEVFGGLTDKIEIPSEYTTGEIIKKSKKTIPSSYDLKINGFLIKDIVKSFDNPEYGTLTRLISLSLRHGAHIEYVCSQLSKDKASNIFSFQKVLSRVLKKYIENGRKITDKICPECSNDSLIYQEGCLTCTNCGYSKCG